MPSSTGTLTHGYENDKVWYGLEVGRTVRDDDIYAPREATETSNCTAWPRGVREDIL